jgi:hypothetical protein
MNRLCLTGTMIIDLGIRELRPFKSSMKDLVLSDCSLLTDASVKYISTFSILTDLSVSGTAIRGEMLHHLQNMSSLHRLDLTDCTLLDATTVLSIAYWPGAKKLELIVDTALGIAAENMKGMSCLKICEPHNAEEEEENDEEGENDGEEENDRYEMNEGGDENRQYQDEPEEVEDDNQ